MPQRQSKPYSGRHAITGGACEGSRVLLVDSDEHRLSATRTWLGKRVSSEIEWASSGDEALDILGAAAQRFDAVLVWPWLIDDDRVDFTGVLRRCNSPLKLMIVTSLSPAEIGSAGRLAGAASVIDDDAWSSLLSGLETLIMGGDRVAEIVATRRVPLTLTRMWGEAIYGAAPGHQLSAPLD